MKKHRCLIILLAFASPLVELAACSNGNSGTDAGPDASKDGRVPGDVLKIDVGSDVRPDTSGDAPVDVVMDVVTEVGGGSTWHTPTCDGVISPGEYGGASYQTMSSTQTWYMTWDATNLYVALDNATLTEANVLYVGYSGGGLKTGQTYDGTNGTLPFAADAVVYAKSTYNEARKGSADAGMWSGPAASAITFCGGTDGGVSTREEVIPWTALGATSIPASFRFLGYATSAAGFVYGQIPTTNPGGSIGTAATFGHDFYVSSTANGTGAFPFATVE